MTTKDRKVRIGFVGVGGMGQCAHLRNYPSIEDCEVVAVAELREETARRVAERYGIPKIYADAEEMIRTEDPDGIVCSQPFNRHGQLLSMLSGFGKPVFIEKPLSNSIATGEAILQMLAQKHCPVMVGYHKRSDPATEYAKAEIDRLKGTGEIGALKYVRILMPAGDWVANGFLDLINMGDPAPALEGDPAPADMDEATAEQYTAFVNYYIHQVNLLRHLLGEPYRPVYADPSGVLLATESESGIPSTIEMSPYETRIDWQEHALVCFEKGWIRIDLPAPLATNRPGKVTIHREAADETPMTMTPDLPWVHAMRQQAVNFVDFVAGTAKAPCEATEALEDLRVAREVIRLRFGK